MKEQTNEEFLSKYSFLDKKGIEVVKHKGDKFLYDVRVKESKTIILQGTVDTLDDMIKELFSSDF